MASTPLLGLSLPADGTTNWGTLVNTSITALLDSAVAGTTTLSTDTDTTLSDTTEAANQARQAIILWKPPSGTVTRTITAPAKSKTYVVINATGGTQSIVFRGLDPITGPTTGVTILAGVAAMVAWNGSDFVTTGVAPVNLSSGVTGVLGVANGGTGQATYTDGQLLIGNSTGNTLTKTTLTGGTGIAITNGAGSITVGGVAATVSDIGMVKLGDAAVQTVAANAVTTTASRTYALQLNGSGQAVVNVPWIAGGGGTPGGSNTQIQFNSGGAFGASANLTFASDTLSVNSVSVGRGAGANVSNTAVGNEALFSNTSGFSNTALGYQALRSNVANGDTTAVGRQAAQNAVGGSSTALGSYALQGNFAGATGAGNIAIGVTALSNFTTANNNIAIGNNAMYSTVASAQQNTAIGMSALTSVSGNNNTALGFESGNAITSGSKNTILGSYSGNQGGLDIRTASNYIVLSDGDGNPRAYWNAADATFNGKLTLTATFRSAVGTVASAATITPTSDLSNQYNVTTLAVPATVAAPSGAPVDGQKLILRIKDNGAVQSLTWDAIYRVIGTTLPVTTAANKTIYVGCIYNSTDIKWDVVAVAIQA